MIYLTAGLIYVFAGLAVTQMYRRAASGATQLEGERSDEQDPTLDLGWP